MMNRSAWLLLMGLSLVATIRSPARCAAGDPLIPRKVLYAESDRLGFSLNGEGTRLAVLEVGGRQPEVVVTDPRAPDEAVRLQLPAGAQPLGCVWSVDGQWLLVTCQVGNQTRVLAIRPSSKETVQLAADVQGSIEIALQSVELANDVLFAVRIGAGKLAYWRTRVDGGAATRVIEADSFERVHFTSAGDPRIALRRAPGGATEILRRDSDQWKPLRPLDEDPDNKRGASRPGVISVVGLTGDAGEVLTIDHTDRDRSALIAVEMATGKPRVLYEDPQADLTLVPVIDRRSGSVLAVSSYFGGLRRHPMVDAFRADNEFLERHFGSPVGYSNISLDDPAWLVVPLDGGPHRFHIFRRESREVEFAASSHSAMNGIEWARRTSRVVPSRDGLPLACDLYVARRFDADADGMPDRPLPALIYIHGGPSIANPWDVWFTNRHLQLLADRGYAVINADFRGAEGYGKAFVRQVWRQWGAATVSDAEDVAKWAVEQRIALDEKIGIWGWSYGGLTTMSALTYAPNTFACGLSMYGLSDMEAFARYASLGVPREQVAEHIGDPTTESGKAALRRLSPIHAADKLTRPILMTHGALDRVAPRTHSDRFVEQLVKQNKPVVYLLYPREGHDYRDPRSWISFWAVAEQFFQEHLGGELEPAGDDLREPPFQVVVGAELIPGLANVRKATGQPRG